MKLIYLVQSRQASGKNYWPDKAFTTKEEAEAYAGTKNLSNIGRFFYTVSPVMLESLIA